MIFNIKNLKNTNRKPINIYVRKLKPKENINLFSIFVTNKLKYVRIAENKFNEFFTEHYDGFISVVSNILKIKKSNSNYFSDLFIFAGEYNHSGIYLYDCKNKFFHKFEFETCSLCPPISKRKI